MPDCFKVARSVWKCPVWTFNSLLHPPTSGLSSALCRATIKQPHGALFVSVSETCFGAEILQNQRWIKQNIAELWEEMKGVCVQMLRFGYLVWFDYRRCRCLARSSAFWQELRLLNLELIVLRSLDPCCAFREVCWCLLLGLLTRLYLTKKSWTWKFYSKISPTCMHNAPREGDIKIIALIENSQIFPTLCHFFPILLLL